MPNIEPIKGLIELQDEFTGKLGLAELALSQFSKHNQESLTAVAESAGLVTAAFIAVSTAVVALGERGSEVNEVRETLVHFAGGADLAKASMDALRAGTKGTVDDFTLAKDAAHLLSTGVKLTADDFGTLGQAAFVLKTRGLGGTKEQLDLVSDALVTGRTRALAMSLGVVAADDAEEAYAKKLGITKDQLSDTGKVEAKRLEVMRILSVAVKDAGEQERSFGDEFKYASAKVQNWLDDLASAVAGSEVFKAGFKAIEDAVSGAFNGDGQRAIKTTLTLIEDGAIQTLDFAQATISMARIADGAWNGVRTVVLGAATTVYGLAQAMASLLTVSARVSASVHLVSPEAVAEAKDAQLQLSAMTAALNEEAKEAARGIFGHTEFSTVLDKLSANLVTVRNAMSAAKDSTAAQTHSAEESAEAAKKNAAAQAELNAKMIDQMKVQQVLIKSTNELSVVWDDYFAAVAAHSGTSRDAQIAAIEATFNKQIASLDALDPLYAEKYRGYRAIADENLKAISVDWDSVKDKSLEGMREMADKALETYIAMQTSGLHFTRAVLDEQLNKYRELSEKAKGWGDAVKEANATAAQSVQVLDHAWIVDADIAQQTINRTTIMVKTLSGELVTLAEAQRRQQTGGTFDVTSANFQSALKNYITAGNNNPTGAGITQYRDPNKLAHDGYSFGEIIRYAFDKSQQSGPLPPPQGPRIPGFREGGTVMVGESGPEIVRLPLGSTVYPTGTTPSQFGGNGGDSFTMIYYVNGTGRDVAEASHKHLMTKMKLRRQYGGA